MLKNIIKIGETMPPPKPRHRVRSDKGHVVIDKVGITFGKGAQRHAAVEQTSVEVKPGEFVCLLGPSGCGKSTLLNSVAGYVQPSEGEVTVDGVKIERPGPDRGMVFQQYSLFPWMTIRQNIGFGPRVTGAGSTADATADTFLGLIGLAKFANRYPGELSGGMQQRVGIARALMRKPILIFMDEPFGALDAQTREQLQEDFLAIWSRSGATVIFVTHSIDEALILSDRIFVFDTAPGRIRTIIPSPVAGERLAGDVRAHPDFGKCRAELRNMLRSEP